MKFRALFFAALGGGFVAALLVVGLLQKQNSEVAHHTPTVNIHTTPGTLYWADEPVPTQRPLPSVTLDLRPAARIATPAVVHVDARVSGRDRATVKALFDRDDRGTPGGEGSGVIYSADGYIVTNYHVVQAVNDIVVTTSDRRRYSAKIVGTEPKSDLAVLKVEADNLPYLQLANSDEAEPGQWVLAVGSPLGLTSTVTAGIVSAKGRSLSILQDPDAIESFIQTDAAVNPGNSGGPLVDSEGRLLGINTAIATRTGRFQGYSFAIPINLVRRIVDDIIDYGSFRRALMGVEISTLTASDIDRLGLEGRSQGVLVDAVFPGGAAARGGLQKDDLIVGVNDRPIVDLPELTEIIGRARPGDRLQLRIIRNNEILPLGIELQPTGSQN